jgi:hypothetical protein
MLCMSKLRATSGENRKFARDGKGDQRSNSAKTVNCCVPSPTTYSSLLAVAIVSYNRQIKGPNAHDTTRHDTQHQMGDDSRYIHA